MNELTIIKQRGGAYIDSREVAEVVGKRHNDLLRDIRGYIKIMEKSTERNFALSDFFIESSYLDSTGRTLPCYLLSKMGCEMVANKLTGEKGVLFTAAYVSKFNEMEKRELAELEAALSLPVPRLGEINACARIVVRGLKSFGASPECIMAFLKEAYEPFGITVAIDFESETAPRWYKASDIAKKCRMYSLYGKPHSQAAACILNENIFVGAEHQRLESESYGDYIRTSVRYDEYALEAAEDWLAENGYPDDIYGFERTYHVEYSLD